MALNGDEGISEILLKLKIFREMKDQRYFFTFFVSFYHSKVCNFGDIDSIQTRIAERKQSKPMAQSENGTKTLTCAATSNKTLGKI
jgi:hypothetical protein